MRSFPRKDRAKQQTEKILEAIRRCENEIGDLQRERVARAEKDRVSMALQYLGNQKVDAPNDTTAQQIAALEAALSGLEVEHKAARIEEDRAFLVDLQEWAAALEPETRALVERGQALRAELKDITARLRILHQDSRLVSDWWARACSRIRASEQGAPPTRAERPLPTKPPLGTIPQGLLND